jgi:phosphoribosylglycinamide formyltransferase-1
MGGVRQRADRLGVPFVYFAGPWDASRYQQIARDSGAGFFALSGWLKLVLGLDPRFTFNIHPGPLPETEGLYSHFVHEAALAAFGRDKNTRSAVCMHFVTPKYDDGPIFFRKEVKIWTNDSPDTLGARVNEFELCWQPIITNLVVQREIRWDGRDPDSLRFPIGYRILREYDEHP